MNPAKPARFQIGESGEHLREPWCTSLCSPGPEYLPAFAINMKAAANCRVDLFVSRPPYLGGRRGTCLKGCIEYNKIGNEKKERGNKNWNHHLDIFQLL
jgi:hypothetical protein